MIEQIHYAKLFGMAHIDNLLQEMLLGDNSGPLTPDSSPPDDTLTSMINDISSWTMDMNLPSIDNGGGGSHMMSHNNLYPGNSNEGSVNMTQYSDPLMSGQQQQLQNKQQATDSSNFNNMFPNSSSAEYELGAHDFLEGLRRNLKREPDFRY